jgi:hypothetical protein
VGYRSPFPGVKRLERGVDQPIPYSGEVQESVDLYLYLHSMLQGVQAYCNDPFSRKVFLQIKVRFTHCLQRQFNSLPVAELTTQGTVQFCNQQRDCELGNSLQNIEKGTQKKIERKAIKDIIETERKTNEQEVPYETTKGSIKEIKL